MVDIGSYFLQPRKDQKRQFTALHQVRPEPLPERGRRLDCAHVGVASQELLAIMPEKPTEETALKGEAEDSTPGWVVKFGAPLAIGFYIFVAVLKTMLTKARSRAHASLPPPPDKISYK